MSQHILRTADDEGNGYRGKKREMIEICEADAIFIPLSVASINNQKLINTKQGFNP